MVSLGDLRAWIWRRGMVTPQIRCRFTMAQCLWEVTIAVVDLSEIANLTTALNPNDECRTSCIFRRTNVNEVGSSKGKKCEQRRIQATLKTNLSAAEVSRSEKENMIRQRVAAHQVRIKQDEWSQFWSEVGSISKWRQITEPTTYRTFDSANAECSPDDADGQWAEVFHCKAVWS